MKSLLFLFTLLLVLFMLHQKLLVVLITHSTDEPRKHDYEYDEAGKKEVSHHILVLQGDERFCFHL
jgi:hypothetical protein